MENLNEHELWIENKSNKSLREIYMIIPVSYFINLIQKKQKEGLNIKENQLLDYMYE